MNDQEFIERAERILENTRKSCHHLLTLVDQVGQDMAFHMVQADLPYSRELMVRMLCAANGATEAELFSIADGIDRALAH